MMRTTDRNSTILRSAITFGVATLMMLGALGWAPPATAATPPSDTIAGPPYVDPEVLAASPDGSLIYVAQANGTIVRTNTPAYTSAGSWNSGIANPLGMAVSPNGATVYISNRSGNLIKGFNAISGAQTSSWATPALSNPTGIGLSPDGSKMYVPYNATAGINANRLSVRTPSNGAVQATWVLGSKPRAAVISPDGLTAYVSMETQNRISVRNTSDGSEVSSWSLAGSGISAPGYLSLSKNGDRLYVTGGVVGAVALRTDNGTVAETWNTGISYAFGVATSKCGDRVFLANSTLAPGSPNTVLAVAQTNQCLTPPTIQNPIMPGNTIASVAFTPGADGGTPITNYEYSTDGISWSPISPASSTSPVVINGLTNATTYNVRLRAVNALGSGMPSNTATVRPQFLPPQPLSPGVIPLEMSWTRPFWASPVTGYTVVYKRWADRNNAAVKWGVYSRRLSAWPGEPPTSVKLDATVNVCGPTNSLAGWNFCPLAKGNLTDTVNGYAFRVLAQSSANLGHYSEVVHYTPTP